MRIVSHFPQSVSLQRKRQALTHIPRHGAPLSALEQIGNELLGIGMMSPIDTKDKLFRAVIQTNTQAELWPAAKFVARLSRMQTMRAFSLTQREIGKILRMAYDDVVNQRWGLDAKLVRTSRDNSELFYITKPVEARRLLKVKDMQDTAKNPKESEQQLAKKSRKQLDEEVDMSFAADRVGKEVGKMEHIANVLMMMIAAEKRERHGLMTNVHQMGQMLDANKNGTEKVQEKMESLHVTLAEDRKAYQEQVEALTQEHDLAIRLTSMKEGLRHLRFTFKQRSRRIVTRAWLYFREFVDAKVRNTAVGKTMCQNIIGKRLLIGKRKTEVAFYRWRKKVQTEVAEEHRQYVQGAVMHYSLLALFGVLKRALHRRLSRYYRIWSMVASMQGRAYNAPRKFWALLRVATGLQKRASLGRAFHYWMHGVRHAYNKCNRVYHLLGKTYRGRLEFGYHRLRLHALNGAFGSEKQREATRMIFRCFYVAIKREKLAYFRKLVAQVTLYKVIRGAAKVVAQARFRSARVLYSKTLERWRFTLRQAARERLAQGNRSNRMAKAALILKNSNQRAALNTWKTVFARFRRIRGIVVRMVRVRQSKAVVHWRSVIHTRRLQSREGQIGLELFSFVFYKIVSRTYYRAIGHWRAVVSRDKRLLKKAEATLRTNAKDYHRRLTGMAWQKWRRLILDDKLLSSMMRGGTRLIFDSIMQSHRRRLSYRFTLWAKESAEWIRVRKCQRSATKIIFSWTSALWRAIKRKRLKGACDRWRKRARKKIAILRQVRRSLVVTRRVQNAKVVAAWREWQVYMAMAVADEKEYVKTMRLFDHVLITIAWRIAKDRFNVWKTKAGSGKPRRPKKTPVKHLGAPPPGLDRSHSSPAEVPSRNVAPLTALTASASSSLALSSPTHRSAVHHHHQNYRSPLKADEGGGYEEEQRYHPSYGATPERRNPLAERTDRQPLTVDVANIGSPRLGPGGGGGGGATLRVHSPLTSVAFATKQRERTDRPSTWSKSKANPFARIKGDMDALLRSVGVPTQPENPDAHLSEPISDVNEDVDVGGPLSNNDQTKAPKNSAKSIDLDEDDGAIDSPSRSAIIRRAVIEEPDILRAHMRQNSDDGDGVKVRKVSHDDLRRAGSSAAEEFDSADHYRSESPSLRRMRRAHGHPHGPWAARR
jgi:hypothetical protein